MRHFLIFKLSLLLSTHLFAQKNKKRQGKSSQNDTAYTLVPLHDIHYSKTLIIEVGEKAKIYLSGDSIVNEATQYLSNDFVKKEYRNIITFLDSAFKHDDTVSIGFYKLRNLNI